MEKDMAGDLRAARRRRQRGRRRDRRMEIGRRSFTVDVAQSGAEKCPPFRSLKDTPFAINLFPQLWLLRNILIKSEHVLHSIVITIK